MEIRYIYIYILNNIKKIYIYIYIYIYCSIVSFGKSLIVYYTTYMYKLKYT